MVKAKFTVFLKSIDDVVYIGSMSSRMIATQKPNSFEPI
jgi:hypothetical protein